MTQSPSEPDPSNSPLSESERSRESNRFPIVGIGASAGGFDALKRLLEAMPEQPNVAFVIIQHLARDKPSLAPELLYKFTAMQVQQVHDETIIHPNSVYIIPPGKYLSIVGRRLRLSQMEGPRGTPVAIDYFFRALAKDQQQCAVGVILSGSGSDGTLGIKAIKEAGGFVIAQDPDSAEYNGMPSSAIATGMVDQTLTPEQIPAALVRVATHAYIHDDSLHEHARPMTIEPHATPDVELPELGMHSVIELLHRHSKRDFRNYKEATLQRRTRRRMCLLHIDCFSDYMTYLDGNPLEIEVLAKDLLISVTDFFRDPDALQELATQVVSCIITSKTKDDPIRVWIPGCATGEEAYTVAMLLLEELNNQRKICSLQIFASDIDKEVCNSLAPVAIPVASKSTFRRSG